MRTDDDACERDAFNTWMKRGKMDTRHLFFFPKIINQETNFSLTTKAIRRVELEKKRAIRVERNLNILTSNVSRFARSNGRQQDVGSEISQLFHLRSDRVSRGGLIAISF